MEQLSDEALEERLLALLNEERAGLAEFLSALSDFDRRRIANKRAYPSTFDYCVRKLGLSEDEAYRRIYIARRSREHAQLLEMIRDGRLSLTAASRVGPSLTPENKTALLEKAAGKSVREIEFLVAARSEPEKPRSIIEIAPPLPQPEGAPSVDLKEPEPAIRFHFTVARAVHEKFLRARDLTRHRRPSGLPEEIFEDALDALLDEVDRSRKERPAPPRQVLPGRRYIPEWVKDLVTKRDQGRCSFIPSGGQRCESTAWLEFDHATPFSKGGRSDDPGNIRLLCRAHNQHAAREQGLGRPPIDRSLKGE
jgi:hypothetical protein